MGTIAPQTPVPHSVALVLPRRLAAIALAAGVVAGAATAPRAGDLPTAEQLKAAFVVNFVKFVEWPEVQRPAAQAPVVISVLGDQAFADALGRISSAQKSGDHPVVVRRAAGVEDARASHLVFIGRREEPRLAAVLRSLGDQPVLTVGDTDGYAEAGVILNLYTFDQRVGIEVNTTAAARAQLRLSAHLLRIARIVG